MEKKPKKSDLPDLYSQEWPKDAENETFESKQVSCKEGHDFKYAKRANEVRCNCGVGYQLSAGMEVYKDGHIYFNKELVI